LDYSRRNPGAIAEVPRVRRGIHCAGDGSWDLDFNSVFASPAADHSVRRIDFISGGEKRASPDSQI
jgi:hypothetical protein